MRLAIAVTIGLLIGLAIGAAGMTYWSDRAVSVLQKANRETQAPQPLESYHICQSDNGKQTALIIKGDGAGAKQIIFPWSTDGDVFRIEQTTDLHYIATDTEAKGRQMGDSSMDLNRVSGDLFITNRFSPAAVQLLASICEKPALRDECVPGMKRLGGNELDCFGVLLESECEKWTSGNNFRGRFHYLCRASERRF